MAEDRLLEMHVAALRTLWPGRVVAGRPETAAGRGPLAVAA